MQPRIIAVSHKMNGDLDDDYTLYEDGSVLHEYDRHRYPGGYNLKETLEAKNIMDSAKERLLYESSEEDKELVKELFGL
ncbi:hypothetical protein [Flavobacterium caseinilyticum]|uniref:Uncharacterized protein n=1 Tax=Flavobacterium caseinilyticum TaxID=2541732 RepID=A0A4V2YTR8_9FLAO|nr:hypothetical protein [Flavobacterium caseinilyticum]TDD74867.1 hypothetical protein E0F89_13225 [Flavobacterium caseinilyticum]